ncbi:MAG: hypothetical protein GWO87_00405 [Xanthomonadaceae bacterium]|nr:hypothetical protein [Rhodospirillaceae bacterium]NIA17642.1 hypothetical protein [Xanthomonadaceae bacterium]
MLLEDSNIKSKLLKFFIKYFNYFLFLIVIIFFIGFYFIFLKPKQNKINRIENSGVSQRTETYEQNIEYFNKIKSFIEEYESISDEDKKTVNLMFPDKLDYPQLFAQMESLIKKNGFILDKISLSPENKKNEINNLDKNKEKMPDFINKVNVSIVIEGVENFADYRRMLNMFYNNLLLMDVDSINYSASTGGSYSINLISYFFKTENSDS